MERQGQQKSMTEEDVQSAEFPCCCLWLPRGWEAEAEQKGRRRGRDVMLGAAARAGLVMFSHNLVEHVRAARKLKTVKNVRRNVVHVCKQWERCYTG